MKNPYPTLDALSAMVRANDTAAVGYVRSVLIEHGGNVQATAAAIGCSERTLYNWRDTSPKLAAAFDKHALGREGAAPIATNARKNRKKP
jgi:L-amino acid N-acyltransferase YncA